MSTLSERVGAALSESGHTQAELAAACGLSGASVNDWLSGKTQTLKAASAQRAASFLGVNILWLTEGRGPMKNSEAPYAEPSTTAVATNGRGIVIPLSSAWGSMGLGATQPENEIIVGGVAVSEDWLRQSLPRISHPSKLAMITAFGHSMAPTFEDGDTLIVDRGIDQIKDDGVFVAAYDDELFIKRFQRRPTDKTLLMKSDNPHYETIVIDTEKLKFEVLGKVVWVWNGKKL